MSSTGKRRAAIALTAVVTAGWVALVDVLQLPGWGWLALALPSLVFPAVAASILQRVSPGAMNRFNRLALGLATGFAAAATVALRILFTFAADDPERPLFFWGYLMLGLVLTLIAAAVATVASHEPGGAGP